MAYGWRRWPWQVTRFICLVSGHCLHPLTPGSHKTPGIGLLTLSTWNQLQSVLTERAPANRGSAASQRWSGPISLGLNHPGSDEHPEVRGRRSVTSRGSASTGIWTSQEDSFGTCLGHIQGSAASGNAPWQLVRRRQSLRASGARTSERPPVGCLPPAGERGGLASQLAHLRRVVVLRCQMIRNTSC